MSAEVHLSLINPTSLWQVQEWLAWAKRIGYGQSDDVKISLGAVTFIRELP